MIYFEIFLLVLLWSYYVLFRKVKGKHRLKIPPGPFCLPIVGYLPFLGKIPTLTISKLSKTYGSIFSLYLGQTRVVFINDYESTKEAGKFDVLQGRNQLELFKPVRGYSGLGLLEGKDWQEMRRFTLKCLKDMGFGKKSMEGMMQEEVLEVCSYLEKNVNKTLYLKPILELAVINSLWAIMTGEKYDIEDPVKRQVMAILTEGIAEQNILGIAAFLPWLAKLAPEFTGYSKGLKFLGAPEGLFREMVRKHVDTYVSGAHRDFIDATLSKIYSTTDENSVFYGEIGMSNLHYTLLDLFFAGSDTLSSTLGWSFLYLAVDAKIQDKVQAEIDEIVGSSRLPCLEHRARMPYTEATMHEVLRKSSFVPLGLMHTALEDTEFKAYFLPKRTVLLFNLYEIHHNKEYWGDPEKFRPERFINDDGSFRKDDHVMAFFTGKRSCPGEILAMNEYFLFFTGILQKYRFALNPVAPPPYLGPRSGFILCPPKHELLITKRTFPADS